MPDSLDAPIAQGGTNVSGGQRQRLALARALVRRPEIYLFDDSFSALDYATDAALRAALRDRRVQAVGHGRHKVPSLRGFQRLPQFGVGGVGPAVAQVGGDRAGEQVRDLRHQPDRDRARRRVQLPDVAAVDEHAAAGGVEQPGDKVQQGGLAASGAADYCDGLAGPGDEVNAPQHGLLGAGVAELDVAQFNVTAAGAPAHRARRRHHAGAGVEHLLDPLGGDLGARHQHEHEGGHQHRHQDLHQVAQEGRQGADLHAAAVDPVPAEPQHRDAGDVHHQHYRWEHQRHQPADAERDVQQLGVGRGEPVLLAAVPHEGPDDADAGDLLAQHAVDPVDPGLHQAEQWPHPGDDRGHDDGQHRNDDEQEGRQRHVLIERHQDTADGHDGRRHDHGERHQDQHLDLLDVVGGARDQRRRAEAADLAGGETQHLVEDR